jgi:hypothetical protein
MRNGLTPPRRRAPTDFTMLLTEQQEHSQQMLAMCGWSRILSYSLRLCELHVRLMPFPPPFIVIGAATSLHLLSLPSPVAVSCCLRLFDASRKRERADRGHERVGGRAAAPAAAR